MTNQQLVQSVWSRIGGKVDWAPAPVIMAKAVDAIKTVTKQMVLTDNPLAKLLIKSTTISSPTTVDGNKSFALSDTLVRSGQRLHSVYYDVSGTKYRMEPANSWTALDNLPAKHNKAYYKIKDKNIFTKIPTNDSSTSYSLYIEHYQYLSIADFPFELIDVLLETLIPMLMPLQQQQPPTNTKQGK